MTIAPADISIVLQGPVDAADQGALGARIAGMRALLPGVEIVLSTWQDQEAHAGVGADRIVLSADPGPLPSVRPGGRFLNNVNRQIVSARTGLAAASRPYACKLRTDSRLVHDGFLHLYERFADGDRIVVPSLFTVDPELFERVPFHVSDWFGFARTETLAAYWSADLMTEDAALHYETHPYAPHSHFIDRRFHCLFPTEQHIARQFAARHGFRVPIFHNDNRAEVLADHRRFLAERLVVAENARLGLDFPNYEDMTRSAFQRLNCTIFEDWLALVHLRGAPVSAEETRAMAGRRRQKRLARTLFHAARPAWPLLATNAARLTVNRALKAMVLR